MDYAAINKAGTPGQWMKRVGIDFEKADTEKGITKIHTSPNNHGIVKINVRFAPWEDCIYYSEKELKPFAPLSERVVEDWIFDISKGSWETFNQWMAEQSGVDKKEFDELTDPNNYLTKPMGAFTKKDVKQFAKDKDKLMADFDRELGEIAEAYKEKRAERWAAEAEAEKAIQAMQTDPEPNL